MRLHPIKLAAALCVTAGACGTSLVGPIEPSDVSMTVLVHGGLTGSVYSIRLDGATGEVRGIQCSGVLCDFQPDAVVLRVSGQQVAALAARVEHAGVLQHDGRDFGEECCDIGAMQFDYRRGSLSGSFEGTTTRIPEGLLRATRPVAALADRIVPMLIDTPGAPDDWPANPYALGDVSVNGMLVSTVVSYGGGCESHSFDLVGSGIFLESDPVLMDAFLAHDAFGDLCEAYPTETRRFDITPLRAAFEASYGRVSEPTTVVLRLAVPGQEDPELIEVVFD